MRPPVVIVVLAGLLTAGALGLILDVRRDRVAAERRASETLAQRARLREELEAATAALAAVRASPPSPAPGATAVEPKATPPPRAAPPAETWRWEPKMIEMNLRAQQAEAGQRYAALMHQLNFSPAEREKFKEAVASVTLKLIDISSAAHAQGLSPNDPSLATLRVAAGKETEREIEALLGEERFRIYREHARQTPARSMVDSLAAQLSAREPLTPAQGIQLTRALAGASTAYSDGGHARLEDVDWAAVDRGAQTFLTPGQFAIWQQGSAHSPYGGSRSMLQLRRTYDAAVKAGKK